MSTSAVRAETKRGNAGGVLIGDGQAALLDPATVGNPVLAGILSQAGRARRGRSFNNFVS